MHGATQRQQADPTFKTDSGTLFNDSQNRQEINSREANLSQTQLPNHDDAASVRMNKSNNCKNSAEEMVMVPKRISPLITNRGSNQASIDDGVIRRGDNPTLVSDDIDDVNPFTVLSEHDQDTSVDDGDDDEEEVGVACFKSRKGKRVETPETFEVCVKLGQKKSEICFLIVKHCHCIFICPLSNLSIWIKFSSRR